MTRRWTWATTVTSESDSRYVQLANGTVMVPARFITTGHADEDDPRVRLWFEVVDGIPQCRRLEITAAEGAREVRATDVHSIHVEHVLELVCSRIGIPVDNTADLQGSWSGTPGGEGVRKAVRAARKGRPRTMTPELLAEVAATYREHAAGGKPTAEVRRQFGLTARTARNYVQRAREAGLLGNAIPGRAGEAADADNQQTLED